MVYNILLGDEIYEIERVEMSLSIYIIYLEIFWHFLLEVILIKTEFYLCNLQVM